MFTSARVCSTGRPVDIEWLKDGSMLLSDDYNGAVYRITYGPLQQVSMQH